MDDLSSNLPPPTLFPFEETPAAAPAAPVAQDWRSQVPTVAQLTRRIRGHVENAFFDVWVRGEISTFRKPASGHAYFILKDATAQLRSVMFKGQLAKLKFQPKEGMEVLMHGTITVYEARGEYQIVADNMEPVGIGALQLAFEQLKAKLHKEGLFDPKHKKPLPFLPKRIGIVTSPTGAAVKDILKVLSRRFADREVFIIPASVQGEKAAGEISAAIGNAQKWNLQNPDRKIEVLIVGRGGGSMEDLWCFNEEIVAKAIFECNIPIISAVGHEIDVTIADFVADVRAPTPSAAAEIVVPRQEELSERVTTTTNRLKMALKKQLQQLRLHVGHLSQRIVSPVQKIKRLRENFEAAHRRMSMAAKNRMVLCRKKLESLAQMLNSLSPLQVLGRGYSITESESGKILQSVKETSPGDVIKTRFSDGIISSKILT